MPIVTGTDPDFKNRKQSPARLPASWWKKLREIAEESGCEDWGDAFVQLVRWSMSQEEKAPLPEGPELRDAPQSSVSLAKFRWDQLDAEARQRGLSRNKVLQAHLQRAFEKWDSEQNNGKRGRK